MPNQHVEGVESKSPEPMRGEPTAADVVVRSRLCSQRVPVLARIFLVLLLCAALTATFYEIFGDPQQQGASSPMCDVMFPLFVLAVAAVCLQANLHRLSVWHVEGHAIEIESSLFGFRQIRSIPIGDITEVGVGATRRGIGGTGRVWVVLLQSKSCEEEELFMSASRTRAEEIASTVRRAVARSRAVAPPAR